MASSLHLPFLYAAPVGCDSSCRWRRPVAAIPRRLRVAIRVRQHCSLAVVAQRPPNPDRQVVVVVRQIATVADVLEPPGLGCRSAASLPSLSPPLPQHRLGVGVGTPGSLLCRHPVGLLNLIGAIVARQLLRAAPRARTDRLTD